MSYENELTGLLERVTVVKNHFSQMGDKFFGSHQNDLSKILNSLSPNDINTFANSCAMNESDYTPPAPLQAVKNTGISLKNS